MGWDARSRERPVVVLVQVETLRTVTDAVEGGCGSEYVGKRTGRVPAAEEPEVDVVIQGDAAGLHPDAGVEGVVAAVVALAVKDGDDAGKVETDVSSEREAIKEEQEKQSVWCVQACILVCANVMKCVCVCVCVCTSEKLRSEHRKQIPGFGNPNLFQRSGLDEKEDEDEQ